MLTQRSYGRSRNFGSLRDRTAFDRWKATSRFCLGKIGTSKVVVHFISRQFSRVGFTQVPLETTLRRNLVPSICPQREASCIFYQTFSTNFKEFEKKVPAQSSTTVASASINPRWAELLKYSYERGQHLILFLTLVDNRSKSICAKFRLPTSALKPFTEYHLQAR